MLPVMCYVSLKWTALQTELICIKQHTLIKKKKTMVLKMCPQMTQACDKYRK